MRSVGTVTVYVSAISLSTPLIPSTKLHMRAYCFGISPYADQFLLLLLLRAERPREQCLLRLGAAGGRQRPERDHYSHSGGAASRRQREQHHRRRRRDRRAGPNRHVADHNTTPQAATPSHQFRHSPKVKTRRSHRLSNVRFRSAHASASDCARRQTCSRRSDQSQEYVSGATSVRAHR